MRHQKEKKVEIRPLSAFVFLLVGFALTLTACQSSSVASRYNRRSGEVCMQPETKQVARTSRRIKKDARADRYESPRFSNSSSKAAQRLNAEIYEYLGVKYRYGGNTKSGIDCSGLVFQVFRNALDLRLPRSVAGLSRLGRSVSISQLRFGDLVFFSESRTKLTHVGIYMGSGRFVHASKSSGVIIDRLSKNYYSQRYKGARRVVSLQ